MKSSKRQSGVRKAPTPSLKSKIHLTRFEMARAPENLNKRPVEMMLLCWVFGVALFLSVFSLIRNGFAMLSNDRIAWIKTLPTIDGIPVKGSYTGFMTSTPNQGASPKMNQSILGTPLSVSGKIYTEGIGTFSPSKIILDLAGKVKIFSCLVGMDARADDSSVVIFRVFADGEKVYESPAMSRNMEPQPVHVDLVGKKNLCLEVDPYLGPLFKG